MGLQEQIAQGVKNAGSPQNLSRNVLEEEQ